jgi:NAD(P)-dependent dehydrogenase (short-subunit alcohol dehydrogenase family)
MSEQPWTGRTAVITGASRGIGATLAQLAADQGIRLGLCARSACPLAGRDGVHAEQLDVCDESALESFAAAVADEFGPIDLWVNNAGVLLPIAPVRDIEVADFSQHIAINLTGAFLGTRTFVRHRRDQGGGGVLINISSGAAWTAYAGWAAYCAGKAGLERLTEVVAAEEAPMGLRAHSVAPGVVDTEMQALIRETPAERFPELERFVEMKREGSFNSAEYVARELLALAFDPARKTDAVSLRLEDDPGAGPG